MMALLTLDWLSHTIFLALYSSCMLVICVSVKLFASVTCGPGFCESTHGMFVLSAYMTSASTFPGYPKLTDFSNGIIVSLLTRSISIARIFVAVGRGASDGSVPITARASLNVTSGVHIVSHAGSYYGRVSLGVGPSVARAGSDRGWRDHWVDVGKT